MDAEAFKTLVDETLDPTSSPGHPWMRYGSTNSEVFKYCPLRGYTSRLDELKNSVEIRVGTLLTQPDMDVINLFIKPEPHKQKKVDSKMWRLISGISVTDQLVAQMLLWDMLVETSDCPGIHGNLIGWGLFQFGGTSFLRSRVPREHLQSADKSSWDWTMQEWTAEVFIEVLLWVNDHLTESQRTVLKNHCTAVLGQARFEAKGRKGYVPPSMKSGWKCTILGNCWMQQILHVLAGIRAGYTDQQILSSMPLAMGDDTIQKKQPERYWKELARTGCILKEVNDHPVGEPFEFVGFNFHEGQYQPCYKAKHAFLVHHVDIENQESVLRAYQWLYLFDENRLKAIQQWARSLGLAHINIDADSIRAHVRGHFLPVSR